MKLGHCLKFKICALSTVKGMVLFMCLAIPAEIIELRGVRALSRIMGAETEISIELLNDVKVGDYVIVHAGCAISIVDKQEAEMTLDLFREIEALGDLKR